jgi:hypothetical protein
MKPKINISGYNLGPVRGGIGNSGLRVGGGMPAENGADAVPEFTASAESAAAIGISRVVLSLDLAIHRL